MTSLYKPVAISVIRGKQKILPQISQKNADDKSDKLYKHLILFQILVFFIPFFSYGQIRVRLFANQTPESAVFTVTEGKYEIDVYDGESLFLAKDEPLIITKFNGKVAVKTINSKGFLCDSVMIKGATGKDGFSLRINSGTPVKQLYSGDLQCLPDLGILVFINICDIEKYIAGVVKTEGGTDKNIEYFKTQSVLARTYMYKYFNKHIIDRYNLCDNTHCQAFNGITTDTIIIRAALETKGLVVLDRDSALIMSAFHSNCGGETSASEDVWLASQPYLKKVNDPYCVTSHNAKWSKSLPLSYWVAYLKNSGYTPNGSDPTVYNYSQIKRMADYRTESFALPFRQIRNDLNLRSSFFSVFTEGDSVILKGRGYGHGVGLCQEGAMVMAAKGFKFRQIIGFYFSGVTVADIKNARKSDIE